MAEITWQEAAMDTERSAEEIQQHILEMEEEISETMDEIGGRIKEKLSWREYVAHNPLLAVGVAAGLGVLAAWMLPGSSPAPAEQEREPEAGTEELSHQDSSPPKRQEQSSIWPSLGYMAFMVGVALAQRAASEAVFGHRYGYGHSPQHRSTPQPEAPVEQMAAD